MKQKNTSINRRCDRCIFGNAGTKRQKDLAGCCIFILCRRWPEEPAGFRGDGWTLGYSDEWLLKKAGRQPLSVLLLSFVFFLRFVQTADSELSGKHQLGSLISRLFILDKSFFFLFPSSEAPVYNRVLQDSRCYSTQNAAVCSVGRYGIALTKQPPVALK